MNILDSILGVGGSSSEVDEEEHSGDNVDGEHEVLKNNPGMLINVFLSVFPCALLFEGR